MWFIVSLLVEQVLDCAWVPLPLIQIPSKPHYSCKWVAYDTVDMRSLVQVRGVVFVWLTFAPFLHEQPVASWRL